MKTNENIYNLAVDTFIKDTLVVMQDIKLLHQQVELIQKLKSIKKEDFKILYDYIEKELACIGNVSSKVLYASYLLQEFGEEDKFREKLQYGVSNINDFKALIDK